MDRPTLHKIITSLTTAQTQLDMTAGELFEEGYKELAEILDSSSRTIHVVRLSIIKHRRSEEENG